MEPKNDTSQLASFICDAEREWAKERAKMGWSETADGWTRPWGPDQLTLRSQSVTDRTWRWRVVTSEGYTAEGFFTLWDRPEAAMRQAEVAAPRPVDAPATDPLRAALSAIEAAHGARAVFTLDGPPEPHATVSSGVAQLDEILGGGWPRGRIIEIFGKERSGRTTLLLHAIAQAQKAGGGARYCAWIDARHDFDREYARLIGVDLGSLLIAQPDTGEQALDLVEALARSGVVDAIGLDSVGTLVSREQLEGDGVGQVGTEARMMSRAMRKIAGANRDAMIFLLNDVVARPSASFGPAEVAVGGNALKYYASVRVQMTRSEEATRLVGVGDIVDAKVVKNRFAAPFRTVTLSIGSGIRYGRRGALTSLGEPPETLNR